MVVDDVHDHAESRLVQGLHHLLEFLHADFAVRRIGRIAAFRHIVVLRIVTPVEIPARRFVNGGIVVNRLQVYVGDTKFLQIIDADGHAGVILQTGFCKRQILAGIGTFLHGV